MAENMILETGTYVFAVLFIFLTFVFSTAILSIFKKDHYKPFEPFVSIVVPCYNGESTISRCLDSVFSLDYPKKKIEVIVVNDGSTDNTRTILGKYMKKHSNLSVIKGNHEGKSLSLNLGVKNAAYDIIMSVDADTFIEKDSLKRLVRPFQMKDVGATNGSCIPYNSDTIISIFQKIEYHYNNLIRKSFSVIFNNGIWFFGAFACYRKSVLEEIGYFKTNTLTEDMNAAMEIYTSGYRTINVHDAIGMTVVPHSLSLFYNQRMRWWIGALQTLNKNHALFSKRASPSIIFLFINQYWWSLYALMSFPLIAYQVYYWLPNSGTLDVALYLFRWFTLTGPIYVLYKIPVWGINIYNIFGVASGIMSIFLIIWAIHIFNDRVGLKNAFAIFFYFPYTLILNSIIVISLVKMLFLEKKYFIA